MAPETDRSLFHFADLPPLGMDADSVVRDFKHYFNHTLGREEMGRAGHYLYTSLALALRDRLVERWKCTRQAYRQADCKLAYYLSLEFLMGRTLGNAMLNLDVDESTAAALRKLGRAAGGNRGTRT